MPPGALKFWTDDISIWCIHGAFIYLFDKSMIYPFTFSLGASSGKTSWNTSFHQKLGSGWQRPASLVFRNFAKSIQVWAFATVSYVNGELFQATARRASEIAKELVAQDAYGGRRIVRVEPWRVLREYITIEDDSLSLYFFWKDMVTKKVG